jgi:hypothetical protein
MIPLAYVVAYFIIRWKTPSINPDPWLILLIPITIGTYYLNACYIDRLYGRHIKKLQELLQELESE